jgi:hypothetical protein
MEDEFWDAMAVVFYVDDGLGVDEAREKHLEEAGVWVDPEDWPDQWIEMVAAGKKLNDRAFKLRRAGQREEAAAFRAASRQVIGEIRRRWGRPRRIGAPVRPARWRACSRSRPRARRPRCRSTRQRAPGADGEGGEGGPAGWRRA